MGNTLKPEVKEFAQDYRVTEPLNGRCLFTRSQWFPNKVVRGVIVEGWGNPQGNNFWISWGRRWLKKKILFFRTVLHSYQNWVEIWRFPIHPIVPTYVQPSPLSTFPNRGVHLLQLMNLHWHIIITKSPLLTLEFTLDDARSMSLDKCILTCIHHYSIIQSSFMALKFLCTLSAHSFLPPWQPLIFSVSIVLPFLEFM